MPIARRAPNQWKEIFQWIKRLRTYDTKCLKQKSPPRASHMVVYRRGKRDNSNHFYTKMF